MASILKVDKLDPQSGTALEIGTSGDTITVPSGATFTVSGTMNASSITAGTVATARLGSGTASSSTVLYGDQTYKAEPGGGKILQVIQGQKDGAITTTSTSYVTTGLAADITPSSSSNKVLVLVNNTACHQGASNKNGYFTVYRDSTNIAPGGSGLYEQLSGVYVDTSASTVSCPISMLDSPSSTSALTYTVYFATDSGGTQYLNINATSSVIQLLEVEG